MFYGSDLLKVCFEYTCGIITYAFYYAILVLIDCTFYKIEHNMYVLEVFQLKKSKISNFKGKGEIEHQQKENVSTTQKGKRGQLNFLRIHIEFHIYL